ncbi:MAG: DeoR/GlpR family DNA-binding transcription regulator, partial [Treponema sp.]|nr:DeoR/GlpR family DNA-binding transcription regulator [Treponema sp.]
ENVKALLMQYLQNKGTVTTEDAAALLHVSTATVRRVFSRLAEDNKIMRFYGGIRLPAPSRHYEYTQFEQYMLQEKIAIGHYAASMVEENDFIFIDCGTTTIHMANALARRFEANTLKNVNIVTNSLMNLQQLTPYTRNIILAGGEYITERKSFSGALTETFLQQFHFSKSFVGTESMTFKEGFMAANIQYSRLCHLVVELALQSFILMDSSKVGIPSFMVHNRLDQVSALITDDKISAEHLAKFHTRGLPVHVAKVDSLIP